MRRKESQRGVNEEEKESKRSQYGGKRVNEESLRRKKSQRGVNEEEKQSMREERESKRSQ